MALNKKKPGWLGHLACAIHCLVYTLPFLFLTTSPIALCIIAVTHFLIDRWYLVPWLVYTINRIPPKYLSETSTHDTWENCRQNWGHPICRPPSVSFLVGVVQDNALHLLTNYAALRWFGGMG